MSDTYYSPNEPVKQCHHRNGDVYHNPTNSSNRGNCFWLPDQWETEDVATLKSSRGGSRHGITKWTKVTMLFSGGGGGRGQRNTTNICWHVSASPLLLVDISSNPAAQRLRQLHFFCTEQQLQHRHREFRPFDVLRVDNTQKCCITQSGGERQGGGRPRGRVGERERATKTVVETSSHRFCHKIKKTKHDGFATGTSPSLLSVIPLHYLC